MGSLTTNDLSYLVKTAEDNFNDVCDIYTPTISDDSYGQDSKTFTSVTNIPCDFIPSNSYRSNRGVIITLDCEAILRISKTHTVHINDEIVCRDIRYFVNGVTNGRLINIVALKRVDANEQS